VVSRTLKLDLASSFALHSSSNLKKKPSGVFREEKSKCKSMYLQLSLTALPFFSINLFQRHFALQILLPSAL
jgi:hypothetical protein